MRHRVTSKLRSGSETNFWVSQKLETYFVGMEKTEGTHQFHPPRLWLLGSWVFTGENISTLRSALSTSPEELTIQEDGEKFAPFRLSGRVVDGNRRAAVGEAVTRLLSFTDGLRPDRQSISVLAALTSDIVAASEAIVALGSEDEPRNVDLQDIQYGLSQLSWQYLVPDLGGDVVSKLLHTLVDAQERLSTAELAERAGCSTRGMASENNR
jgi:hypothetical protein